MGYISIIIRHTHPCTPKRLSERRYYKKGIQEVYAIDSRCRSRNNRLCCTIRKLELAQLPWHKGIIGVCESGVCDLVEVGAGSRSFKITFLIYETNININRHLFMFNKLSQDVYYELLEVINSYCPPVVVVLYIAIDVHVTQINRSAWEWRESVHNLK